MSVRGQITRIDNVSPELGLRRSDSTLRGRPPCHRSRPREPPEVKSLPSQVAADRSWNDGHDGRGPHGMDTRTSGPVIGEACLRRVGRRLSTRVDRRPCCRNRPAADTPLEPPVFTATGDHSRPRPVASDCFDAHPVVSTRRPAVGSGRRTVPGTFGGFVPVGRGRPGDWFTGMQLVGRPRSTPVVARRMVRRISLSYERTRSKRSFTRPGHCHQ